MITTALNRDADAWNSQVTFNETKESYHVESTGATLTADSSISLIYRYCGKLPRDKYDIFQQINSLNGRFHGLELFLKIFKGLKLNVLYVIGISLQNQCSSSPCIMDASSAH